MCHKYYDRFEYLYAVTELSTKDVCHQILTLSLRWVLLSIFTDGKTGK